MAAMVATARLRVATRRPLPPLTVKTTRVLPLPTGMLGAVIRTSTRRSPTTRPAPRLTKLSLMTNGTTRTRTSGVLRLGARTEMSTVPPPTVPRPPMSRRRATVRALTVLRSRAPLTLTARLSATARATVARLPSTVPSHSNPRPPRLDTVRDLPSGLVPPRTPVLRRLDTTTTSGPSRLPVPTSTPDTESPTTPSPPSLTTTRSTPDGSRPMTTSGLRTTTDMTLATRTCTARPPPTGRTVPVTATARDPREIPPPLPVDLATGANPAPTGMLMAEIRTSRLTSLTR